MTVRVALIGYGYWGEKMARVLDEHAGFELIDIVDHDEQRLQLARSKHPAVRAQSQLQDWQGIDALAVFTPLGEHDDWVEQALFNEKSCLVAKPLTLSQDRIHRFSEIIENRSHQLMVDQTFLFSPAVQALKSAFEENHLGQLNSIYCERLNRHHKASNSHIHWDLFGHDLSILWHLKEFEWKDIEVEKAQFSKKKICQDLTLRLHSDCDLNVRIHLSGVSDKKRRIMIFKYSHGNIVYDEDTQEKIKVETFGQDVCSVAVEATEPLKNMIESWFESIIYQKPNVSDLNLAQKIHSVLVSIDKKLKNL